MSPGQDDRQPMMLDAAIRAWWQALRGAASSNEQLARWVREAAERNHGWKPARRTGLKNDKKIPPSPNGKDVGNWIRRGTFHSDDRIRAASVSVLRERATVPEGMPEEWHDPQELLSAFLRSKNEAGGPQPTRRKTQEEGSRQESLAALLGDPEAVTLTVEQATQGEQMRAGFRQGSWLTDNQTPPYVPRHADEELRRKTEAGFVVVSGPPKAGKTRSLLEALREVVPHKLLWRVPPVPGALDIVWRSVEADGGRPPDHDPAGIIVLLDDLQRHDFASTEGITHGKLLRLRKAGVTIAATVHNVFLAALRRHQVDRTRRFREFEMSIGASPQLVDLLHSPTILWELSPDLTGDELDHADPDLLSQARSHDVEEGKLSRLPELLAAVDTLFARADEGRQYRTRPERAAIISAAIDASYVYPAGATEEELRQLTEWAFTRLWPTKTWREEYFSSALDWATDAIGGPGSTHAIVHPTATGRLRLFDPLLPALMPVPMSPEHLDNHKESLSTESQFHTGFYCWKIGDGNRAIDWWHAATSTGHTGAMNNLGVLLKETGRPDDAEHWYRLAADTGHTGAMYNLGILLYQTDRLEEAEHWWRRAAGLGHSAAADNLQILRRVVNQTGASDRG